MRWPFVVFQRVDLRDIAKEIRRCADALDRIAPLPEEITPLKPEEAVTYTDEEAIAKQEEIDELGADAKRISEWLREHPEFDDDTQEDRRGVSSTPSE